MTDTKITEAMAVLELIEKRVVRDCETHAIFGKMSRDDKNGFMTFRIAQVVAIYCAHETRPQPTPVYNVTGPASPVLPFVNCSPPFPLSGMGEPCRNFEAAAGSFGFTCKHCQQQRSLHL